MINQERYRKIDRIFQAALELDPDQRPSYISQACSGDESLLKEIESLLSSDGQEWELIKTPAFEMVAPILAMDQPELFAGETIGHYKISSLLGAGGMGQVYLAEDSRLGRKVALKLLPLEFTRNVKRLRRFQNEARAASALNHPNILTIYDIAAVNEKQLIATEFVDGETLRHLIKNNRLGIDRALDVAIQVGSALATAHQAGIIHRDIKPENIMLRRDGLVKVLDFGLAKLVEGHSWDADNNMLAESGSDVPRGLNSFKTGSNSDAGLLLGTLPYMSPEQAGGLEMDARSDIFSLGIVIYEMVTGRAPFSGESSSVIAAILNDEPSPIIEFFPDAPAELQVIVSKALRKKKGDRYQTAEALLIELKRLKEATELESKRYRLAQPAANDEILSQQPHSSSKVLATLINRFRQEKARSVLALATVLIVLVGAGVGLNKLRKQGASTPFQKIEVTKFTNFGDAWAPSISPDGKYVVYAKNKNRENSKGGRHDSALFSLWLRAVGTSIEEPLVPPTPGRCYTTSFSPDGEHIYYGVGAGAPVRVFVIPTAGGKPTQLPLKRAFPMSVSPDGNSLAYVDSNPTEGKTSVVIANADGTDERDIVTREEANYFRRTIKPSWSPDGKLIACVGQKRGESFPHVFEVNIEARTERPITAQKWTDIRGVAWLPDMSGLLLVGAEETSSIPQIWHIDYPSGAARRITNDAVNYSGLSLSADGKALVTTGGEVPSSIWVMPVEDTRSEKLSVDTSKARQIDFANLTNRDDVNNVYERLSWTPDGRIVYMSKESGNADIWSINSDGRDRRQLTTDPHADFDSVTSPDGRYVAFVSNRAGAENIWIMDIDGGNQRRLTSQFIERSPDFSADSKWVFFNSWETGKAAIWKIPVEGGEHVNAIAETSFFPTISPDGSLLAYVGDKTKSSSLEDVFISPSGGGPPIRSFEGNFLLNWTPNGKGLTYPWQGPISGQPHRSSFNLWEQLLDGSPPRQLTAFDEPPLFVHAWSRDGRQLAVLRATYTSDVVLITDFK